MGIKLINGIVIGKTGNYLKIIREDRKEDGYDLLIYEGAAKDLRIGSRFSLYVTSKSVKTRNGKKIMTYINPTLIQNGQSTYNIEFRLPEIEAVYWAIITSFESHNYRKENMKGYEYDFDGEIEKKCNILKIVADRIADSALR